MLGDTVTSPQIQYRTDALFANTWWEKFLNKVIYGDTYPTPVVKAPPVPSYPVDVLTVPPANETSAQASVDAVIQANAKQNADGFMQTINQAAENIDKPSWDWGLLGLVGVAVVGTMLVKGRR